MMKTHAPRAVRMAAAVLLAAAVGVAAEKRPAPPAKPTTQPTHKEGKILGRAEGWKISQLTALCLGADGKLLACDAGKKEIKVISPAPGKPAAWKLDFKPTAIHACPDGAVYVGGKGTIARLDVKGKLVKTIRSADGGFPNGKVSGITASDKDVFVSIGSGWSRGAQAVLIRFDRDLGKPRTIARGLRGCCQRLDIVWRKGVLYVAENTRYRVVRYDREGKVLGSWGRRSRRGLEGFGSCCNPMNLAFGPGGELYTAESGLGRIKRYAPEGKFLGLVGSVGTQRFNRAGRVATACSNIALAVTPDGKRVYVMDYQKSLIRVLDRPEKARR